MQSDLKSGGKNSGCLSDHVLCGSLASIQNWLLLLSKLNDLLFIFRHETTLLRFQYMQAYNIRKAINYQRFMRVLYTHNRNVSRMQAYLHLRKYRLTFDDGRKWQQIKIKCLVGEFQARLHAEHEHDGGLCSLLVGGDVVVVAFCVANCIFVTATLSDLVSSLAGRYSPPPHAVAKPF